MLKHALVMTSPYLDRPLVPLAVALPRMLENIETELTGRELEATETGAFASAPS